MIEIIHVKMIHSVEMNMPEYILSYTRLYRQDPTGFQAVKGALRHRRCLEIATDVQQAGRNSLRKQMLTAFNPDIAVFASFDTGVRISRVDDIHSIPTSRHACC